MPFEISHSDAGGEQSLAYSPREVALGDGTRIAHTSRGGDLEAVWAGDLGGLYVEVVHLGDGPAGGELVLVVPDRDLVAIGDLYEPEPAAVPAAWPVTLDLVLGLLTATSTVHTSHGSIDRDALDDFHQYLLGRLYE